MQSFIICNNAFHPDGDQVRMYRIHLCVREGFGLIIYEPQISVPKKIQLGISTEMFLYIHRCKTYRPSKF